MCCFWDLTHDGQIQLKHTGTYVKIQDTKCIPVIFSVPEIWDASPDRMDWTLVLSFRISAIFHCFFGSHFPSASRKWWCGSFFKISARDTAGLLLDSADLLLDTTGLLLSALDFRACIFVDLLSKGLDSFSNLQKTHLNQKLFILFIYFKQSEEI